VSVTVEQLPVEPLLGSMKLTVAGVSAAGVIRGCAGWPLAPESRKRVLPLEVPLAQTL
jgi:hypothetical protein